MVILEQHGLLTFRIVDAGAIVYSVRAIDVRRLTMSVRCILTAKTLFGELAETIVEELFANGRLSYSQCIGRTAQRLEAGIVVSIAFFITCSFTDIDSIKHQFIRLADSQFIMRCARVSSTSAICPKFVDDDNNRFVVPDRINVNRTSTTTTTVNDETKVRAKRKHCDTSTIVDSDDILWCINWQRFELYFRDEIVLDMIASIGDQVRVQCVFR